MSNKPINIPLTGLWMRTDKNGNTYYTGSLGNARLMVFKNNRKENDNQPDYIMFLTENKKREEPDNSQIDDSEEFPF